MTGEGGSAQRGTEDTPRWLKDLLAGPFLPETLEEITAAWLSPYGAALLMIIAVLLRRPARVACQFAPQTSVLR